MNQAVNGNSSSFKLKTILLWKHFLKIRSNLNSSKSTLKLEKEKTKKYSMSFA